MFTTQSIRLKELLMGKLTARVWKFEVFGKQLCQVIWDQLWLSSTKCGLIIAILNAGSQIHVRLRLHVFNKEPDLKGTEVGIS